MKNTIHMLQSVTNTICNSFIITTETGELIVIDGGFVTETDHFLRYLKETAGTDTPHIDAWFLSHPHDDHIEVFYNVIENHAEEVTIGKVYANFPSSLFFAGRDAAAERIAGEFQRLLPLFADKYTIVSGGDEFDIGAAHIKMLYSTDFEFKGCNDSSLVFRMELGGKSILFTGDCGVAAGRKILRLWKDSGLLKCDICQMAHHGQNGCDRDFYEAVAPEICLWCTPSWLWTNDNGTGPYKTLIVRKWMEELGVRENLVMYEGTKVLEL